MAQNEYAVLTADTPHPVRVYHDERVKRRVIRRIRSPDKRGIHSTIPTRLDRTRQWNSRFRTRPKLDLRARRTHATRSDEPSTTSAVTTGVRW